MARRLHLHVVFIRCFIYGREHNAFCDLICVTFFESIVRLLVVFSHDGNGSEGRRVNNYCVDHFIGARPCISIFRVARICFLTGDCHASLLYQGIFKRFRTRNVRMLYVRLHVSRFLRLFVGRCNSAISA